MPREKTVATVELALLLPRVGCLSGMKGHVLLCRTDSQVSEENRSVSINGELLLTKKYRSF